MTRVPEVWMIDPAGKRQGTILYSSLTATVRHLAVGAWVIRAPLRDEHLMAAQPGWRVGVMDDSSTPVIAGPVTGAQVSIGSESDGRVAPELVLSGVDDMTWLDYRWALPKPSAAVDAQDVAYDVRSGTCSTVLLDYIRFNAGSMHARTERRVPGLVMDTDPVAGGSVTGRGRFQPLLELVRPLAITGGLGIRVRSDTRLEKRVQVYVPRDLRGPARFSLGLRNLKSLKWQIAAPTATTVAGGGRGEEAARLFISASNSGEETAWGRREGFYDFRSASDSDAGAELTQGTNARLAEAGATQQVEVVPIDTPRMMYGIHYGVGDQVTVGVLPGLSMDGVIQEVEIRVERSGNGQATRTVRPRVGDLGAGGMSPDAQKLRFALARLTNLERR